MSVPRYRNRYRKRSNDDHRHRLMSHPVGRWRHARFLALNDFSAHFKAVTGMGRLRFELRTNRLKAERKKPRLFAPQWVQLRIPKQPPNHSDRRQSPLCRTSPFITSKLRRTVSPTPHRAPKGQPGQDREPLDNGTINPVPGPLTEERQ